MKTSASLPRFLVSLVFPLSTCLAPPPACAATFDASASSFSSALPVVVLEAAGSAPLTKDAPDRAGRISIFEPRAGRTYIAAQAPTIASALTLSVRGASSAEFPKKSFNLTLRKEDGTKRSESLLGLPAAEKWALVASWTFDPSFLNNALIYALSNQIGRWAPRTRFVEVFLNPDGGAISSTHYVGIYVLTERIERGAQRVDLTGLTRTQTAQPELSGGYIFKIDAPDATDTFWPAAVPLSPDPSSQIVVLEPKAEDIAPAQRDYLRDYLRRMENALRADAATGWSQRSSLDFIDRASWVDHHLLNTFACNPDAFTRSAYFTKDRGCRIVAGPVWDFDRALGSYQDERSYRWDLWAGVGGSQVWNIGWWGILARDPEFVQDWIDRWQALRLAQFSSARLAIQVKNLADLVGTEAATRDAARWPDNASPYGSYTAQINRLVQWVTQRAQWIDEQFVSAPEVRMVGDTLIFTAPPGAELIYTLDGSDPRCLGGQIAPNVKSSAAPLQVAKSANIHVRSYRRDLAGAFPSSPWSAARGSETATPLTPRSSLANLSSRGFVGADEQAMILGVSVSDTTEKSFLARGIGPGLARFGVTDAATGPALRLFAASGFELAQNTGWETSGRAAEFATLERQVGAFPLVPRTPDSALRCEVASGAYTLELSSSQSGTALAELYVLDDVGRAANLATRAWVREGDTTLVSGFVVKGPAVQRVLLRAIGPTLRTLGMADAITSPVLRLFAGSRLLASSERPLAAEEKATLERATQLVGAFPLAAQARDVAFLVTLPAGSYTAELASASGEGIALLEIYDVR